MSRTFVYLSGESQPLLDPDRRFFVHAQPPKPNLGSATLSTAAYTCPELGRTCMRPGAYDALALPSLIAGERRYPDGRVERAGARSLLVAAVDVTADRTNVQVFTHTPEAA